MRYLKQNLKRDTMPTKQPMMHSDHSNPNPYTCLACASASMTNDEQLNLIMDYENGTLDQDNTIRLFQHLVNTGLAWQLQGSYGRTAMALIKSGLVKHA